MHPDRLYAEFEEESLVQYIYSFARFLSAGIHLHLYVPTSFFQRYLAIKNIEYPIRKAPGNYKTKIKFGFDDLILSKRCATDPSWITVHMPLDTLPPVDLTNALPPSHSPPIGRSRSRVLKRKERSPLDSSRDKMRKSTRSYPLLAHADQTNTSKSVILSTQEEENVKTPLLAHADQTNTSTSVILSTQEEENVKTPDNSMDGKTPTKSDPSVASAKDHGSFQPSACVSPRTALNKNFTFVTAKSSIPTMKSLLN